MKIKAVYDLLQLILVIMEDFVRKVYSFESDTWHDKVYNILKEIVSLKKYYNDSLEQIFLVHGGKIPRNLLQAIT